MDIFLRPISYFDALTLFQKKKAARNSEKPRAALFNYRFYNPCTV